MAIQDSGKRREFETGAVRDIAEGKGRCDLLPLDVIGDMIGDDILICISDFIRLGGNEPLEKVLENFCTENFDGDLVTLLLEVSKHYEEGCTKYGDRNWEKGIPIHCYIDSGVRHYLKLMRGDTDERHDRAFIWNMLGALWTLRNIPEMNDLPSAYKNLDNS